MRSPIDSAVLKNTTGALATIIDKTLNGDVESPAQPFGWILITFEVDDPDYHYAANIDPPSAAKFLRHLAERLDMIVQ